MPALASPTLIGVFFDPEATDCDSAVAPFVTLNVYVSAVLGTDAAGEGFNGAAFRVTGLTGIVLSITSTPAATIALGDPTSSACHIAFPACMVGEGPRRVVSLYTIACAVPDPVLPRTIAVVGHASPDTSDDPCKHGPCVVLCDSPVFTKMTLPGGHALLNNGTCNVGVRPSTWSTVKSIFAENPVLQVPVPGEPGG
jgi:hypothetical protein